MTLKISLITVTYNSAQTLQDTISSVAKQEYPDIEYIVVDGSSKDNTVDIIRRNESTISNWVSEPDKGMYDAMNKGINMATGDVIGILNSDDFFFDTKVLAEIAAAFNTSSSPDAVIGDIVFVDDEDENKIIRRYSAKKWKPSKFAWGYMPPHPSFFVRKEFFDKLGPYKTDYKIAADYELLIRFLLKGKINWKYLPIVTTKMRMGGLSTQGFQSLVTLNKEIARGCKENQVYTNPAMIYSKYLFKPFEFIFK
ncbi:glycosyltransferase family 2 protein [Cyclobacterium marinum]|uniref:Glycosyl transferase family 2 n=1 Tax=Cyclobacterium marinum (strain ATCC 25205 / DSM 745 / LMG 13164 / NCIMB 1802) TaxID=880070 RepID=G0J675_CYCMS|nr:glycosyltransferase family 2 protein [Cyclobacterium marinum]AEL26827.1 glycosyl transferase family 2 [Cyclobacterium marinum DSM 745]